MTDLQLKVMWWVIIAIIIGFASSLILFLITLILGVQEILL